MLWMLSPSLKGRNVFIRFLHIVQEDLSAFQGHKKMIVLLKKNKIQEVKKPWKGQI